MRIPSYDDLTPSIPDISPGDVFASTAALLPSRTESAPSTQHPAPSTSHSALTQLFASLHGAPDDRLVAIARDFSPRLERWPGGSVVLDVAGLQRLLGEPPAIAAQLAQAGAPSVAMATTQIAALLLARGCGGVTVATGHPEAGVRDIPLTVLRELLEDLDVAGRTLGAAAGSSGQAFDVLRRWGLGTIGEFAALPAPALSARLGADGVALQRLARGIDPRPLVPDPGVTRFRQSFELEWPIDALEPLSFVFARLLDPLAAALERADRGAVAMHLTLRLTDRTSHVRSLQLPAPMRDPRVLRTLLLLDLESHPPSAAVDVVSIELDPAPGRIVQYSLLERAVPSPETLVTLMARLGALVGDTRCGSPVLLDTHRPDAFAMEAPVFHLPRFTHPLPRLHAPDERGGPRGDLESPAPTLRRFRPPVAIRVAAERGRPVRVAIDRQQMPGGLVQQSAGPWRTSGEWWQAYRWNRDEWDVALSDGSVCRLFQDRDGGAWFLEGIFD